MLGMSGGRRRGICSSKQLRGEPALGAGFECSCDSQIGLRNIVRIDWCALPFPPAGCTRFAARRRPSLYPRRWVSAYPSGLEHIAPRNHPANEQLPDPEPGNAACAAPCLCLRQRRPSRPLPVFLHAHLSHAAMPARRLLENARSWRPAAPSARVSTRAMPCWARPPRPAARRCCLCYRRRPLSPPRPGGVPAVVRVAPRRPPHSCRAWWLGSAPHRARSVAWRVG